LSLSAGLEVRNKFATVLLLYRPSRAVCVRRPSLQQNP